MNPQFFIENRTRFFQQMEENAAAVFFAGEAPVKQGDEKYPFSPDRNFYYLTGIEKEHCILILQKDQQSNSVILLVERDNGPMARWVGSVMRPEEAREYSGIDDISYIDEFPSILSAIMVKKRPSRFYIDAKDSGWSGYMTPALSFAEMFHKKYPTVMLLDAYEILSELRTVKQPEEIRRIRKAIAITQQGIETMMRYAKPGMMEYEIEAYFDDTLMKNGIREKAFCSIAASGRNGTVLHYTQNNAKTKDGDLILFDVGAQYQWYNGDLSRTFPVNGAFTEVQKKFYRIVLEGQKRVIDAVRPGVEFPRLNEILKQYYTEELKRLQLISRQEELSNYYFHNVSHFLGALTHDVGDTKQVLKPGMVLTVEPGLYLEEMGLGIRIEDDILVTENGAENLSSAMIKTVEEIEAFMSEA